MTVLQCPECGGKVSTKADKCPHCGAPPPQEDPNWQKVREFYLREIDPKADRHEKVRAPYSEQEVAVMLSQKKKTNHLLHLVLSIVTGGLWLLIWLVVAMNNKRENEEIDRRIAEGKKV